MRVGNNPRKVFVHDPARENSFSCAFVYSLLKDRDGRLWVGCGNDVDSVRPTKHFSPVLSKWALLVCGAANRTWPENFGEISRAPVRAAPQNLSSVSDAIP